MKNSQVYEKIRAFCRRSFPLVKMSSTIDVVCLCFSPSFHSFSTLSSSSFKRIIFVFFKISFLTSFTRDLVTTFLRKRVKSKHSLSIAAPSIFTPSLSLYTSEDFCPSEIDTLSLSLSDGKPMQCLLCLRI